MAQRERYKATVKASKGTPPQQDFTAYHAKLKAEQNAARGNADSVRCRRVAKNWPSPQKVLFLQGFYALCCLACPGMWTSGM